MVQSKGINFSGQNIYIGIDVHLKSWHVTVLTESGHKRKHSQEASASALFEYLKRYYPGGHYQAIYESGFSGFSTYYALSSFGIKCVIAHAADVPTGQNESVLKSDSVDSEKLARTLRDGSLKHTVYVPDREILDHRGMFRFRRVLQNQLSGHKARVKHLLYSNGVSLPEIFANRSTHWSRRFMRWLQEDVRLLSSTRETLDLLLDQVERLRIDVLAITRQDTPALANRTLCQPYEPPAFCPGYWSDQCHQSAHRIGKYRPFPRSEIFCRIFGTCPHLP